MSSMISITDSNKLSLDYQSYVYKGNTFPMEEENVLLNSNQQKIGGRQGGSSTFSKLIQKM